MGEVVIQVGSRWIRKRLVRGERRIAVVLSVGVWGEGIIEYRYIRPLADGYGRGAGKLAPRVNATVASKDAFLRAFELSNVLADHGG